MSLPASVEEMTIYRRTGWGWRKESGVYTANSAQARLEKVLLGCFLAEEVVVAAGGCLTPRLSRILSLIPAQEKESCS